MPIDYQDSKPDAKLEGSSGKTALIFEDMDSLSGVFSAVGGVCIIVFLVQKSLEYLSSVNWGLAAALSAAVAGAYVWMTKVVKGTPLMNTRGMCAVHLSLGLLIAVVIAGWISYALHTLQIGAYEVASIATMDVFMRLYFYTLADLIPVLDITETLHLTSPVATLDFFSGLPVLAFKAFILWFLFDEFRAWRKHRKDVGKAKVSDLLFFSMFFLIFVATVLQGLR